MTKKGMRVFGLWDEEMNQRLFGDMSMLRRVVGGSKDIARLLGTNVEHLHHRRDKDIVITESDEKES